MSATLTGGKPARKPRKLTSKPRKTKLTGAGIAPAKPKTVKKKKTRKPKTKKTEFLGLTHAEKAAAKGVKIDDWMKKVDINNFRKKEQRKYFKEHASGIGDTGKRRNLMSESWQHANKLARAKFAKEIKSIGLNEKFHFK